MSSTDPKHGVVRRPARRAAHEPGHAADAVMLVRELAASRTELTRVRVERDRLRAELERARCDDPDRLLRLVADHLPALVAYLDAAHRYRFANRAYEEWFGLAPGATLGRHVREVAGEDVYRKRAPLLARAFAGETISWDEEVVRADGATRMIRMAHVPHVAAGRVLGVCFMGRDVTDERRNEATLRRLGAIVASCQAGIVAVGLDGTVLDWNDGARRLFGWSAEEIVGRTVDELVPADGRGEWRRLVRRAEHGRNVDPVDAVWRGRDGRPLEVSLAISPFRDEHGHVAGASVVALDVAARKAAERELEAFNARLEHLVARRTAEAVRRAEQLRALASELTVAEQRERRRVAGLLHDDLQQLILAARMKTERLTEQSDPDPVELGRVRALLSRALDRTRDLTVELRPPVLYQSGLPAAVAWLGRRLAADHGLAVEISARGWPDTCRHLVDPLLFDAIRELLANVVKHAGVCRARVELVRGPRLLRVTIEDGGCGFVPEARVAASGFGLFSVEERIVLLGGRVEVRSEPGHGTRVTLTLPAGEAAPAEAADARDAGAAPDPHIRVVVADAQELVRDGVAGLLDGCADVRVVGVASGGRGAVDLARRLRPDVVVLDLDLPDLDGIEVTRRICASMDDVRVVGLTGRSARRRGAELVRAGASGLVPKSGPVERLLDAIRAAVPAAGRGRP